MLVLLHTTHACSNNNKRKRLRQSPAPRQRPNVAALPLLSRFRGLTFSVMSLGKSDTNKHELGVSLLSRSPMLLAACWCWRKLSPRDELCRRQVLFDDSSVCLSIGLSFPLLLCLWRTRNLRSVGFTGREYGVDVFLFLLCLPLPFRGRDFADVLLQCGCVTDPKKHVVLQ